jgi:cytochrome subunit of sulfide dehydrogenase
MIMRIKPAQHNNQPQYLVLMASLFINVFTNSAIAETPSATMLANTCAGCHGTFGSSVGPASPTIAGMSSDFFIETMLAYKKAQRPATIMTRIAKGYTEQEIQLMAGYFSKQDIIRFDQAYDAKKARRGKKLHKKYCNKCHEEGGGYAEDDAGILAGQWAPFLQFTLTDFLTGERTMGPKKKQQLDKLIEQQGNAGVEQLIQFYASE